MTASTDFRPPRATQEVSPYPMLWPPTEQRKRSHDRKAKRWGCGWQEAVNDLRVECAAAGIHDFVLSTNREPGARTIPDPGAVLWFMQRIDGAWSMSYYAADAFRDLPENVKAIAMTIQRLRQIGDYGCYTAAKAMRGAAYTALPAPDAPARNWWEVLDVAPTTPRAVVEAAYKALAKQRHPDAPGGSEDSMRELNAAFEAAKGIVG